jgi:hypothetical protein
VQKPVNPRRGVGGGRSKPRSVMATFSEVLMGHDTFRCGDLEAVIGDNAADGSHRAGYNGIWSLKHATAKRSPFVPSVAGLNHEHIFDGATNGRQEIFFEPRYAPMEFERTGPHEALLHQPPTPTFHVESWTRFRLREPHYIDFEFRCIPRQHAFRFDYIGLFWASYIHAPEDKSVYFRGAVGQGNPSWMQLCTQRHDDESTVLHSKDDVELKFDPAYRDCLFKNFSPMRYDLPFYYGLFDEHLWLVMFDRTDGIRFAHSPSGGGFDSDRQSTNPAWDFQFIIPKYDVNREYGFRLRAAYRPRCSREEVLAEYHRWRQEV